MRFQITTDEMPERDRMAAWQAAIFDKLAITAEPLPDAKGPYQGRFTARSNGPLLNCAFLSDGFRAVRRGREIAWRRWDGYRIYRESSPGVLFRIGGEELITRPGDLIIADADAPFEAISSSHYHDESWLVPRALIDPHLPIHGRPPVTRLSHRAGVNALAASYLEALTRNWEAISEENMESVADTLARLIGIAWGAAAAEQPNALRAGRLIEARRYIDRNLADPDLSPATAAAALRISVRSLHLLFEPTGDSFARIVLRRRLEACRSALLANAKRSVTDIAFSWGFNSLSGFYRAFQAAFGMSPGEVRATCRDSHQF
jgi:AraC-like DNA-binding protein